MAEGVNDAVVSPATTGREAASRVRPVVALVRELFENGRKGPGCGARSHDVR